MDIALPVMDGYEIAERLGSDGGYGQESDRMRSRAAGFHRHLVKPIDLGELEGQ